MDVVLQYLKEVFVLKIRIKFTKTGSLKFIGHLDVMRYFQKLNRRAGIDMKYSQGFNPHQIMSFAQPLGIGLTSVGEYVDIEVNSTMNSIDAVNAYNQHSVPEIQILSYRLLEDNVANAMSQVAAADYIVNFREEYFSDEELKNKFEEFMASSEIMYQRVSKKTTRTLDIKPFIYKYECDGQQLFLQLSTGSVENLKPESVIDAFFTYLGKEFDEYMLLIERTEVYGLKDEKLIPLEDFGEEIE